MADMDWIEDSPELKWAIIGITIVVIMLVIVWYISDKYNIYDKNGNAVAIYDIINQKYIYLQK